MGIAKSWPLRQDMGLASLDPSTSAVVFVLPFFFWLFLLFDFLVRFDWILSADITGDLVT